MLDDALRVSRCQSLFPVLEEDLAQVALAVGGEHEFGRQRRLRIHPHVQRGVMRIGEAALHAIQLQ